MTESRLAVETPASPLPAANGDARRDPGHRLVALGIGLAALTVVLASGSLLVGAGHVGVAESWAYLLGDAARADTQVALAVETLRLPRVLVAVVVGCALGVAGAMLQAATRNPLAETGLLGVNAGAALAVVVGITYAGAESGYAYLLWAIGGALAASTAVLALAGAGRAVSPLRLVLAGAALGATLRGVTSFLLLGNEATYDQYRFWALGSLYGVSLKPALQMVPVVVAGLVLAAILSRPLSALALGDDAATALGHRPGTVRILTAVAVTLLTGASVALVGPIAFLGLVAPYVARAFAGPRLFAQIVLAGLTGSVVLLAADIAARVVSRPYETPVSMILALIGAPALIAIVRSRRLLTLDAPDAAPRSGTPSRLSRVWSAVRRRSDGVSGSVTPPDSIVVRRGSLSLLLPRRSAVAAAALAAALLAAVVGALVAATEFPVHETAAALFGYGDTGVVTLIQEFRLPRVMAGVVTGAALGLAGCLTQTLARNRLATPDFLGVNDGAAAVVAAVAVFSGAAAVTQWWAAPVGGVLAAALILLIAGGMGTQGYRILVAGVALAAILDAATELVLSRLQLMHANAIYTWTMGSLYAADPGVTVPVGIGVAVLVPVALLAGRQLSVMRFDEDVSRALGVNVRLARLAVLGVAVALASLAVGIAGPIVFVALAAPIVAARIAGPARAPMVGSALVGAVLVVAADSVGRLAVAPSEVPVGVVASVVGGPFLLWVLLSRGPAGQVRA